MPRLPYRHRANHLRLFVMLALAALGAAGRPAAAKFAMPSEAPVDRLIKNITAYTKENPKDAQGFYTLGRVHYLALWLKSDMVKAFSTGDEAGKQLPQISEMFQGRTRPGGGGAPPAAPTEEQLIDHLRAAIENFHIAIKLDGTKGLYHLGLASVLEQGSALADKVGLIPVEDALPGSPFSPDKQKELAAKYEPLIKQLGDNAYETREAAMKELRKALKEQLAEVTSVLWVHRNDNDAEVKSRIGQLLAGHWKDRAAASYLEAYKLAIAGDLKIQNLPLRGLGELVGYEAGQAYVRLVNERGASDEEKKQTAKVQEDVKALEGKPMGGITPIIFSLDAPAALADLLDPDARVKFNLDGTGRGQTWPWVKPGTGILAWDPRHTGQIDTGWQLFGSVTFFMFWEDGYHALDALDDNRDGKLEGEELAGLAVWFDRDGDGRSGRGEVVPIEKTGIKSLRTRATSKAPTPAPGLRPAPGVRPGLRPAPRLAPAPGDAGDSPSNSAGLIMRDGRVLPTYDWVARPAAKKD